jgi:hypothetical protein
MIKRYNNLEVTLFKFKEKNHKVSFDTFGPGFFNHFLSYPGERTHEYVRDSRSFIVNEH